MNKALVYTVIAILLGSVTMLAPLALLGPKDSTPDAIPELVVMAPEAGESNNQNRTFEDSQTLEGENLSTENWTRPEATTESDSPSENSSHEYTITAKTAENPPDLSPIGLITIPSFLVALGVFVYLRKRIG
ncbi:MAG: hypothetical protein PVH73_06350 [Candidatus Bathyarchaeota archaeon]